MPLIDYLVDVSKNGISFSKNIYRSHIYVYVCVCVSLATSSGMHARFTILLGAHLC